ncbi:Regulating synaptic membrane exocytosis protein 2-like 1 [Homarus americanus]|uniref:Regulating synaptic membrane exocytosis protein 2-like 1 n=1 Tax=Homarus americanus TaxID=6706 RepID=A0A8J5ND52_HOMAM|nr:Regulating synaptic membrane exocytosis protein 2-like 1 [Homarus americanus]
MVRRGMYVDTESASTIASTDHLSPPSTTSRLSESDMSDIDLEDGSHRERRTDGASISSVGSSSSPPPEERQMVMGLDHRSRRDAASPPGRRRTATIVGREDMRYRAKDLSLPAHTTRARSQSAAPTDSPSLHVSRSRSKSPRRAPEPASRSLSPPEARPGYGGSGRMPSRSATATPTGSPKKRQLPQIPVSLQHASRDKVTQDLEERTRQMKFRMRQRQAYRSAGPGSGGGHLHSGYSDSELRTYDRYTRGRGGLVSPEREQDRDFTDSASDIESVVSVTSAFSTQSERPRGSRKLSRRHLSSLKSNSHGYDVTLDHPKLLTDFDYDSGQDRDPSCSLLDVSLRSLSPVRRPPVLKRSLSMGVTTGVSRSAPHLAVRPRLHPQPQPRALMRSNTVVSAAPRPSRSLRHRLQKSHSLGENDRRWLMHHDPEFLIEQWDMSQSLREMGHRGRSRSLTRDDLVLRSHPKKTVTYEDEVLSKQRVQDPSVVSRSSLSIDKSVPYESDLVVREHMQDSYIRKSRAPPDGYSQAQNPEVATTPPEALRGLYRRRSSVRLADGHSAGTYYGYDSDYSGAETEVFLPDRSLDRSFSLEQVDQRDLNPEFSRAVDKRTLAQQGRAATDEFLANPLHAMQEGSSQTLPRARRPTAGTQPRRTFVRANTESALLRDPNKVPQVDLRWKPSREEREGRYNVLRETSVDEAPLEDRRPLEPSRGLHDNPSLVHVFDGGAPPEACGSDDVSVPMEQRRRDHSRPVDERVRYSGEAPPQEYDKNYEAQQAEAQKYQDQRRYSRSVSLDQGRRREQDLVEERRYHQAAAVDHRRKRKQVAGEGRRYREQDPRSEERYVERDPREEDRYRVQDPREGERYLERDPRDEAKYQEQIPIDEAGYRERDPRDGERYRERDPRDEARYREVDPRDEGRYREHGPRDERRPRERDPRDEGRYREHDFINRDRYQEPLPVTRDRYRDDRLLDKERYREEGQERYREEVPLDKERYREEGHERYREEDQERYREEGHLDKERYREEGHLDKERYREEGHLDKERYRDEGHIDKERYREEGHLDKERYREEGHLDKERYRDEGHIDKERYREEGHLDKERYREEGHLDKERYREEGHLEKERYRDEGHIDKERYREEGHLEKERYRQHDGVSDARYREQGAIEKERYIEQGAIEKDRYRRQSTVADERYRDQADIDYRRYRDQAAVDKDGYRGAVSLDQERYRVKGLVDQHAPYREEEERAYHRGLLPEGYNGQVDDRRYYDPKGSRKDLRERKIYDQEGVLYVESYEGEDPRYRGDQEARGGGKRYPSAASGYVPNFTHHDPPRPQDRRDSASHLQHPQHPHDLAHAHGHPTNTTYAHPSNTTHAHPSNTHETYADLSYNVAESRPQYLPDADVVEGENLDTDRPLTPRVRHSSSVSINEHPEYFEFDANSPPSMEPRADADVDPSSNPASEFSQRITAYGPAGVSYGGASKRGQLGRSLSTSEVPETEKAECSAEGSTTPPPEAAAAGGSVNLDSLDVEKLDGSLSDSATGMLSVEGKERRRVNNGKQGQSLGLSKKSSSTSKLSDTGRKRKLGFRKKSRSQITVHRSEEVLPTGSRHLMRQSSSQSSEEADGDDRKRSTSGVQRSQEVIPAPNQARLVKQPSKESTDGSMNSISSEGSSRVPSLRLGTDGQLSEFIEGLGPGQLVGRQVLAAPALGDIQLSMCERKNKLEVEVIRARGLQCKTGSRVLPAPYVKVYLVAGKKCVAKAKTATARRTLDPLYQQQLIFHERYQGCVLQVTVWGDYGRMEGRKVFMGLAQIMLDDLDLSNIVIGWYKLFGTSSLVSLPTLTRRGSMASLDSFG